MVILLTGATHTGKTVLAQRLMERLAIPYCSLDHLKMGLIRSGYTALTPYQDDALTDLLWPIAREMIKTVVENRQNLILEGAYIPFSYADDFTADYTPHIRFLCLVMSERYLRGHYADVLRHANDIEHRLDDSTSTLASLIEENARVLAGCRAHGCPYHLIDSRYDVEALCALFA